MSALTSTEKLVLLAVLAHWSTDSRRPWPGAERLAKWTSLNPRVVLRVLKSLEAKGALEVTRTVGKPNVYDLRAAFEGRLPVTVSDGSSSVQDAGPVTLSDPTRHSECLVPVTLSDPKGSTEGIQEGIHLSERASARGADAPSTQLALLGGSTPKSERTQTLRSKTPSKSKSTKPKPWRRVPEIWEPNAQHRELATELGVNLEGELSKFRDHEFRASKTDADAAFRTWLRNAKAFGAMPRLHPTIRKTPMTQPNDASSPFRASDFEVADEETATCT